MDTEDEWDAGITSAQHRGRRGAKAVRESHLPAIIGTASPNLHNVAREGSNRDKATGALSLTRHDRSPTPTKGLQATTVTTGPRSSVDRAGAF